MTETTSQPTTASANGTSPAPAPPAVEPCEDCASSGEKALAILGALFGIFLIVMAFDMFSGGRVTGYLQEQISDR